LSEREIPSAVKADVESGAAQTASVGAADPHTPTSPAPIAGVNSNGHQGGVTPAGAYLHHVADAGLARLSEGPGQYLRYHTPTRLAEPVVPVTRRFEVRVNKLRLARLLVLEAVAHRSLRVIASRPCVYGVFSGPVGGFAPRSRLCVGCLRCTTEYPKVVQIVPNPARSVVGDSYFTPNLMDRVLQEATNGRVPVKGAGFRGRFGGEGFDGMWTDMSEIVRPTRDGIHGREFISTVVDIGTRPAFLSFDDHGNLVGPPDPTFPLQLPIVLDAPVSTGATAYVLAAQRAAAQAADTLSLQRLETTDQATLGGPHVAPVVGPADIPRLAQVPPGTRLVEVTCLDDSLLRAVRAAAPAAVLGLRMPMGLGAPRSIMQALDAGVAVAHLEADLHGRGTDGAFAPDSIRAVHSALVEAGCRDQVTLLASGGFILAEHVAKGILCGLDAVAIDTAVLVALQGQMEGEARSREASRFSLPEASVDWAAARVLNLLAAWHDQLLELMGAMGLREVRRMRGETGRIMFQGDLEREAFAGIAGYDR